ncbi:sigma-54 interaction domain-containing protein [Acerihabitans arboris]|uniref:HTH-type transcriptional regulatory protein TyrR n=1 Tax=Acerihabitans arboris TaxID=2691583 RepID=A0A845SFE1_9GAMM|nr:sigma 54-interacting transcriptional regulator [Acerihabitans arboris]NDL62067.1 AAA domain-containing protein [Acerihabitans arboris]
MSSGNVFHTANKTGIDFKKIVDTLECPIYITNSNGVTEYINQAYLRENPIIDADAILGRTIDDIIKEGKYFKNAITMEVLKQKKAAMAFFVHHLLPEKMAFVSGMPVLDEENKIEHVVSILYAQSFFQKLHAKFNYPVYSFESYHAPLGKKGVPAPPPFTNLIGISKPMEELKRIMLRLANTDASVLISGESGTGKEVVAENIQKLSARSDRPFIKLNCAAIPASLIESELFGYEKGAFTGATSGRAGFFEQANGGTIFLDEIDDLSFEAQARLSRVLQQKEIVRVGSTKPVKLNVRVIAATHSDLDKKIADKQFREDLFYRLSLIPIHLIPLRERKSDIPLLTEHFLHKFDAIYNRIIRFPTKTLKILVDYAWPGNIRELENIIEYLYICSDENFITEEIISPLLGKNEQRSQSDNIDDELFNFCSRQIRNNSSLPDMLSQIERTVLALASEKYKSTYHMATALGVSQPTIVRKMQSLGLGRSSSSRFAIRNHRRKGELPAP